MRSLRKSRGGRDGDGSATAATRGTPKRATPTRPSSKQKGAKKKNINSNGSTHKTRSSTDGTAKVKAKTDALKEKEEDPQNQDPTKRLVKPPRQIDLNDDERNEEMQRILTGDDPNLHRNVCEYSYKDRCFKLAPPGPSDHMAVHFSSDGSVLHIESKDYEAQKELEDKKRGAQIETRNQEYLEEGDGREGGDDSTGSTSDSDIDGSDAASSTGEEGSTTTKSGVIATTSTKKTGPGPGPDTDIGTGTDDGKNHFN